MSIKNKLNIKIKKIEKINVKWLKETESLRNATKFESVLKLQTLIILVHHLWFRMAFLLFPRRRISILIPLANKTSQTKDNHLFGVTFLHWHEFSKDLFYLWSISWSRTSLMHPSIHPPTIWHFGIGLMVISHSLCKYN